MKEYELVLKFALPNPEEDASDYLARLEAGGCDDALVGVGKRGRIALECVRSDVSAIAAVVSAIAAVSKVIPGVRLIEASPVQIGLNTSTTSRFDAARYLVNHQTIANYLDDCMEEGGAALFLKAVGEVSRAHDAGRLRGPVPAGLIDAEPS